MANRQARSEALKLASSGDLDSAYDKLLGTSKTASENGFSVLQKFFEGVAKQVADRLVRSLSASSAKVKMNSDQPGFKIDVAKGLQLKLQLIDAVNVRLTYATKTDDSLDIHSSQQEVENACVKIVREFQKG